MVNIMKNVKKMEVDTQGVHLEVERYPLEPFSPYASYPFEVRTLLCDKHKLKFLGRRMQERGKFFPPAVHMEWMCERCSFTVTIYKSVWDFIMKGGRPQWR